MAAHLPATLPLAALTMARWRGPPAGLVHHSDRGCQYSAAAYRAALRQAGLVASTSRADDCYDNGLAERFFATLKRELVDHVAWPTRTAARKATFEWIEVFYNRVRLHAARGDQAPAGFEARWGPMRHAAWLSPVHQSGARSDVCRCCNPWQCLISTSHLGAPRG